MPKLKSVERIIANIEGFEITIRHADGRDMRGDKEGLPTYPYQMGARNEFTVAQWRDQRFKQVYVGFEVTVWTADGSEAHGATKLSTLRETYFDD
jgi:hypothetical protein